MLIGEDIHGCDLCGTELDSSLNEEDDIRCNLLRFLFGTDCTLASNACHQLNVINAPQSTGAIEVIPSQRRVINIVPHI